MRGDPPPDGWSSWARDRSGFDASVFVDVLHDDQLHHSLITQPTLGAFRFELLNQPVVNEPP